MDQLNIFGYKVSIEVAIFFIVVLIITVSYIAGRRRGKDDIPGSDQNPWFDLESLPDQGGSIGEGFSPSGYADELASVFGNTQWFCYGDKANTIIEKINNLKKDEFFAVIMDYNKRYKKEVGNIRDNVNSSWCLSVNRRNDFVERLNELGL